MFKTVWRNWLLSLLILIIIIGSSSSTSSGYPECSLYSSANFLGEPFLSLKDSQIVFSLSLSLDKDKNFTVKSVNLPNPNKGCKLIACSEPKFGGSCKEFSETTPNWENFPESFESFFCKCRSRINSEREKLPVCGSVHSGWYFTGRKKELYFPGSSEMVEGEEEPKSVRVEEGCSLLLWKTEDGHSKIFGESVTFLDLDLSLSRKDGNGSVWSCCYCDLESEHVCLNARKVSEGIQEERRKKGRKGRELAGLGESEEEEEFEDLSNFAERRGKIIGIGRNYRWKKSELAKVLKEPEKPIVFLKPSTSYIKEGSDIVLPASLGTIFYEVELGLVIGKAGKAIPVEKAKDHISGYFLALDMTAKDFLKKSVSQSLPWEIAKGFDTACPVSHYIPKSLIPDPDDVELECRVNGVLMQKDNTRNMIFNVSSLVSYISRYMRLQPGDTILTGTPDGLGPVKKDDRIQAKLGNLMEIEFRVVEDENL